MEWTESGYSERTAFRFASSGARVRIVTAEDACEVCKARAQGIYTPSEVPRLPIRGCLYEHCRCRFVAVDPETKLTVPQLVQRGIRAFKAGQKDVAQQILRRAVALDDEYEESWLWLSGVVGDREKIACLQKVIDINPDNQRAQQGLKFLREKLGALSPEQAGTASESARSAQVAVEKGQPAEPASTTSTADTASLPLETVEVREERQVILEQWSDFMSIAVETDPQMLSMQGRAFLSKWARLNERALAALAPSTQLDELRLQWSELEALGETLAEMIEAHRSRRNHTPAWQAMHHAMRDLAEQLLDQRRALRAQIAAAEK